MATRKKPRPVIGWREFVELTDLIDRPIKAKIDTGARTSALHAFALEVSEVDGVTTASFEIHPEQRSALYARSVTCEVAGFRKVRSSNGKSELRPVIETVARIGKVEWPIEITLTRRDDMGFRMLLGRSAVRKQFLVHPSRSYLLSTKPEKEQPK